MKTPHFRFVSVLILGLVSFTAAGKSPSVTSRFSDICPEISGNLDRVTAKSDVAPTDLRSLIPNADVGPTQDGVAIAYDCLTKEAPARVDKLKGAKQLSEDNAEKIKTNLRKLAGFVNNIPSGTRSEAGINFNFSGLTSDSLKRYGEKEFKSDFDSRFNGVNDVGTGGP